MKYSCYEYNLKQLPYGWIFEIPIYTYMGIDYVESDEWYDDKESAEIAAKHRIDLLENGE